MENDRVEQAVALFTGGMACSQAILATYGPLFGFDRDEAIRIARGFGGGMGRLSETCGAVTGAFMAISLKFDGTDKQTKEDNYALMQEFARRFKSKHHLLNCTQLLDCDLGKPEDQAKFRELGRMQSHCICYVREAAQHLEELLELENKPA